MDYTLPDQEMMERRAGAAVDDFIRAVFPGGCPSEPSKPGAKRKVNGWVGGVDEWVGPLGGGLMGGGGVMLSGWGVRG